MVYGNAPAVLGAHVICWDVLRRGVTRKEIKNIYEKASLYKFAKILQTIFQSNNLCLKSGKCRGKQLRRHGDNKLMFAVVSNDLRFQNPGRGRARKISGTAIKVQYEVRLLHCRIWNWQGVVVLPTPLRVHRIGCQEVCLFIETPRSPNQSIPV